MLPSCVNSFTCDGVSSADVYSNEAGEAMAQQITESDVKRLIAESRKGFPAWAKESLGFAIVMGGAAFIVASYIPEKITSQTSAMGADVGALKESVGSLKTDVADIKKDIKDSLNKALDRAYPATTTEPKKKNASVRRAVEFGNSVLELANSVGVVLDKSIQYGQSTRQLSRSDPSIRDIAWRGTNLALGQRALLNAAYIPMRPVTVNVPIQTRWALPGPVLGDSTLLGKLLPGEEGAFSDKFTEPHDPNKAFIQVHIHNNVSPEYLLVQNADAVLDEFHLRRIIYKNSRIAYHGGRVDIKMLYFDNCTFGISPTAEGEAFSKALLETVPMSFSNGSDDQ